MWEYFPPILNMRNFSKIWQKKYSNFGGEGTNYTSKIPCPEEGLGSATFFLLSWGSGAIYGDYRENQALILTLLTFLAHKSTRMRISRNCNFSKVNMQIYFPSYSTPSFQFPFLAELTILVKQNLYLNKSCIINTLSTINNRSPCKVVFNLGPLLETPNQKF